MEITEALSAVQERIKIAAVKAGRDSDNIKLVAVSKTVELPVIIEAVKSGVSILGENRVQEAREKISNFKIRLPDVEVKWHLIGNLQKNKAKTAVLLFDLIHSVDSEGLADELNKQAGKKGKKQSILIQVKLTEEAAKHGISEEKVFELFEQINRMDNLKIKGLMTMPPFFSDPEKTRPYFVRLRQLADRLTETGHKINELSMGMSNDFETAIEEGATMVRIGTAIFGERHV